MSQIDDNIQEQRHRVDFQSIILNILSVSKLPSAHASNDSQNLGALKWNIIQMGVWPPEQWLSFEKLACVKRLFDFSTVRFFLELDIWWPRQETQLQSLNYSVLFLSLVYL